MEHSQLTAKTVLSQFARGFYNPLLLSCLSKERQLFQEGMKVEEVSGEFI